MSPFTTAPRTRYLLIAVLFCGCGKSPEATESSRFHAEQEEMRSAAVAARRKAEQLEREKNPAYMEVVAAHNAAVMALHVAQSKWEAAESKAEREQASLDIEMAMAEFRRTDSLIEKLKRAQ